MTQLEVTVATPPSSSSYQQTVVSTSRLPQAWIKKEGNKEKRKKEGQSSNTQ